MAAATAASFKAIERPSAKPNKNQPFKGKLVHVGNRFSLAMKDDDLALNNALAIVFSVNEARESEQRYVAEAAGNLIIEADNQGIRRRRSGTRHALKALHRKVFRG